MSDGADAHRDMVEALEIESIMDEKSKIAIALRRAKAEGRQEGKEYALNEAAMRAGCAAHRACCGIEADNSQGKIHGCCVVCGVPWPCETAQFFLFKAGARAAQIEEGA